MRGGEELGARRGGAGFCLPEEPAHMLTVCICEGELGERRAGAGLCLPEEPAPMLTVCICEGELG